MGKAEALCRLADDCRKLVHRELGLKQRMLLWLAADAWTVEITEDIKREHLAKAEQQPAPRQRLH
jgi:hypothetical protein